MSLDRIMHPSGDAPKPETNTAHLRVYGNHLWPFVQQANFALEAKNIPFQKCELDLRVTAQWHLNINGGDIPLLETPDGKIISDSKVISDFASNFGQGQGLPLWPHEAKPGDLSAAMATGAMKLEMLKFDKFMGLFAHSMFTRHQDEEKIAKLKEALPDLEAFVVKNLGDNKFMGGEEPMYIDMYCFPLLERFALLENSPMQYAWDALDLKNAIPTVLEYVNRFREHPKMSKHVTNQECSNLHMSDWLTKEPGELARLSIDYLTPLEGWSSDIGTSWAFILCLLSVNIIPVIRVMIQNFKIKLPQTWRVIHKIQE